MKITKEFLKYKFKEYNEKYFNGILENCRYSVIPLKSIGTYVYDDRKKIPGHIYLTSKIDWNDDFFKETLLHEMIHHYIKTIEHKEGGLFGHNWRFQRQCKRLLKEYGIIIHIKNKKPHKYL